VLFVVNGVGFGVWAALLPSLQTRLALDDGALSGVLFAMVVGALGSMAAAGRFVPRYGSRAALRWIAPAYALALSGPVLAPNLVVVTLAAAIFGACKGAFDVTANAQSVVVEKAVGRPILSSFQALWSFGGLGAAGLVGLALKLGLSPLQLTLGVTALLFLAAVVCSPRLLGEAPVAATTEPGAKDASGRLWPVGLLAFVALFTEGVLMDWSAIFAQRVAGAAPWLAPLAYGVFSVAMGGGRLVGDRMIARWGPRSVLRFGGWLAGAGLGLVAWIPQWPVTFVGLVAVGFGLANLVPLFLGAAGRIRPRSVASAIAAVSLIGYTGFLAGPPVVGLVSEQIGLTAAFALVALLSVALALAGPALLGPTAGANGQAQG
jgi:MFS family permease